MNHHPTQRLGWLELGNLPGLSRIRPFCPLIRGCHTYILYPKIGLKQCGYPDCYKIKELGWFE